MSLRSSAFVMVMPLLAALAGCDRQGAAPAQPPSGAASDAAANSAPGQPQQATVDRASHGALMPNLTVSDPSGAKLTTTSLKGKAVLVNLWATWCGPCVGEMPQLDALADKYRDKIAIVTVSQDSGAPDRVVKFFAAKGFRNLHPWLDPDNQFGFHYNTGLLPTSVLYDAQGREVWRMVGGHDWSTPATDALLNEALRR